METIIVIGCVVVMGLFYAGIKIAEAGRDAERFMNMLDIQQENDDEV